MADQDKPLSLDKPDMPPPITAIVFADFFTGSPCPRPSELRTAVSVGSSHSKRRGIGASGLPRRGQLFNCQIVKLSTVASETHAR